MQIRVSVFISLDGVVQAPGGPEEDTDGGFAHGGWSMRYFDDTVGNGAGGAVEGVSALLFGRRTWEVMAAAWPERAGDPFADLLNEMPKYVVSSTVTDPGWGTTAIAAEGWADRVRAIKAAGEADGSGDLLVMGSATLARGLLAEGLVDDLRLMIEPVVLGGGKSIWPGDGVQRGMRLVDSTVSGTGVLVTRYAAG